MLPKTFPETVALIKQFALKEFDQTIKNQQLYYHNRWHINAVQRRADHLFKIIAPCWIDANNNADKLTEWTNTQLLLELCVIAHDMVQIFVPQSHLHTSRRRKSGESERATCEQLVRYIRQINSELTVAGYSQAQFSEQDIALLRTAILGTICTYSPVEKSIYQPVLYDPNHPLDIVTHVLALADICTLGIEGITMYNREGSLLFLEENPDIVPFIRAKKIAQLPLEQPELAENFRQRLLKRARWQVSFARSRFARIRQELLAGLPNPDKSAIPPMEKAFPYLNTATLEELEKSTPVAESVSLERLLSFFQLEKYVGKPSHFY